MKAKILTLLVAVMITLNVTYANGADNNVTPTVLTSFSQQFEKASDVQWLKMDNYYKATFSWNSEYLTAFYNEDGSTIAVAKNITQKQLPILLQASLADEYKNYWVTDLFEYNNNDSVKYYVTVESADKKIVLESMDRSYWEVFKKTNKE